MSQEHTKKKKNNLEQFGLKLGQKQILWFDFDDKDSRV